MIPKYAGLPMIAETPELQVLFLHHQEQLASLKTEYEVLVDRTDLAHNIIADLEYFRLHSAILFKLCHTRCRLPILDPIIKVTSPLTHCLSCTLILI